jgi:tetraacyldisaccharide 4'-kinase
MPPRAPGFWYRDKGLMASALSSIGDLYARIAAERAKRIEPYRSRLPVICVGNFTLGGGGKTPTALSIAETLKGLGAYPAFLTRGYGGKTQGAAFANEDADAADVGDETLLLAAQAPTVVAADRAAGARLIETSAAGVIVMDDGFQNPGLKKDLSLIVVDAASGIGNGLVFPAGPLRAPLDAQIAQADALLIVGVGGKAAELAQSFERQRKPVLRGKIVSRGDPRWLGVLPIIAFAGIARPEKFFATLRELGGRVEETRSFADHHRFTQKEANTLLKLAKDSGAMLVTTEKDWARLPAERGTPQGELKFRSRPLPIRIDVQKEEQLKSLLQKALSRQPA